MPTHPITVSNIAAEYLTRSARRFQHNTHLVPRIYKRLSTGELYRHLTRNFADHKGNAAMAYGSLGKSGQVTTAFDFGVFICPGVANLTASLSGTIIWSEEMLLLLHYLVPTQFITQDTRLVQEKKKLYTFAKPLAMMCMRGTMSSWDIAFTASASIGATIPVGNGTPLGAFGIMLAGASLSISGGKTTYKYVDDQVGWYRNSHSRTLRTDFKTALGRRHTHELKREAVEWLQRVRTKYVNPLQGTQYDILKQQFKDLPKFRFPGFRASTDDVLNKLNAILVALNDLPPSDLAKIRGKIKGYQDDVVLAQSVQEEYREPTKSDRAVDSDATIAKGLSFLTLFNHRFTGSLMVNVARTPPAGGESLGLSKSIFPAGEDNSRAAAMLEAAQVFNMPTVTFGGGSTLNYASVRTSYRYQTYAKALQQRVVYTQDTQIRYTEKDVTVAVQAGLNMLVGRNVDLGGIHIKDNSLVGLEKAKESTLVNKKWGRRSMYYRSVSVYWPHNDGPSSHVTSLNGSGISFGLSVRMQDMLLYAAMERQNVSDTKINNLVEGHANYLRITTAEYRSFIRSLLHEKEADVSGLQNCMESGAVLVESSFRFKEGVTVSFARNGGSFSKNQLKDLTAFAPWNKFVDGSNRDRDNAGVELEAVRLRLRLGDSHTASKTIFRLGFYLFGTSIGFKLDNIEAAGNEGILDLHTHNYLDFDQDRTRFAANLRDGVPPVMLVPHHFNS